MISIRDYLEANRALPFTEGTRLTDWDNSASAGTACAESSDDRNVLLARILLEGLQHSLIEAEPGDSARLQASFQPVLDGLQSGAASTQLLVSAAQAMDALKLYNEHIVEALRRPASELQAKVKFLTDAITAISSTSSENIRRLRGIKSQMLSSMDLKDLRSLRLQLSDCLDGVLSEAERQQDEADRAACQLHGSSPGREIPSDSQPSVPDPVTGLPVRASAEDAIALACQEQASAYVVVMVINQIKTFNRSFGNQCVDAVLRRFANFVRQQLPAVDLVFRWSEGGIVALVRRRHSIDWVRGEVETMLAQRLTIKIGHPDIQIPISCRRTILPLIASPRLLFRKIDGFVSLE